MSNPSYSSLAILCIALGVQANVAFADVGGTSTRADGSQLQLAGLSVNGQDKGNIDILKYDDAYYLSTQSLSTLGITSIRTQADDWQFDSVLGQKTLDKSLIIAHQNDHYISLDTLRQLGVFARYVPADLKIDVLMYAKSPNDTDTNTTHQDIITHKPAVFGIQGMSFDGGVYGNRNSTSDHPNTHINTNSTLSAFGYAKNGNWGVQVSKDDKQKATINNAYWTTANDKFALRLGNTQTAFDEITGIAVAYSNANIKRHLSDIMDGTTKSLLETANQDFVHVKGVGIAGGVAELLVDGRPIAKVQTLLDGRYEFLNLDMTQINRQSLIQVAIYEHPFSPIAVRTDTISLAKRTSRVATDELLLGAGIGQLGVFDDLDKFGKNKDSNMAYGHFAYGLNNHIALTGGVRYAPNDNNSTRSDTLWRLGTNIAPNQYSNIDVSYQSNGNHQLDMSYYRQNWHANYRLNRTQGQTHHSSNIYYQPKPNLNVSIHQSDKKVSLFANAKPNPRFTHGTELRNDGYWRYHANYTDAGGIIKNSYRYSIDPNRQIFSISEHLNAKTALEQSIEYIYRPKNQEPHRLSLSASVRHHFANRQDLTLKATWQNKPNRLGIEGYWQYHIKDGVELNAGYHQNRHSQRTDYAYHTADYQKTTQDNGWFIRVRLDGYKLPAKPPKFGRYTGSSSGQAIITINHDNDLHQYMQPDPDLLDARWLHLNQRQGYFYVGDDLRVANTLSEGKRQSTYALDLPAGVHRIGLDGRTLPIQYSLPANAIVQIQDKIPTYINWKLAKSYGIRGITGKNTSIQVWQNGKLIAQSTADDDGYFLLDGLANGDYVLRAKGYDDKHIFIHDDYVLGVVMQPTNTPNTITDK
ncbi:hypothetical protein LU293_06790 [Moraxella nasovis]|uniref:hypothetical protein n=1 Tax=Moraxella nasovis TaxID=2904121 RepID=UPI001F6021AA|nr:hypothetical protein [Moraxella nasovis]UNU72809.1 hypothetical protein LU293_06790 [Moraxella nasovis]